MFHFPYIYIYIYIGFRSSSQLTNSNLFQRGGYTTTNQKYQFCCSDKFWNNFGLVPEKWHCIGWPTRNQWKSKEITRSCFKSIIVGKSPRYSHYRSWDIFKDYPTVWKSKEINKCEMTASSSRDHRSFKVWISHDFGLKSLGGDLSIRSIRRKTPKNGWLISWKILKKNGWFEAAPRKAPKKSSKGGWWWMSWGYHDFGHLNI